MKEEHLKYYLINLISQTRLSNITILNIEREITKKLNILQQIINNFAYITSRKNFFFEQICLRI